MSIEELLAKASDIIKTANLPDRQTLFQIEKFVIGKEPTAQSQLWAIVRELEAKHETVEMMRKDLEDAEDNLELNDLKVERLDRAIRSLANLDSSNEKAADADLNIKELEINIRKLRREKEALVKAARKVNHKLKGTLEEMRFLVAGYERVTELYGQIQPFDDEKAQKEMWNEKLLEEFNLRLLLQRPFDTEFVRCVLCLHDDAPVKQNMIALVNSLQQRLAAPKATKALPTGQ